MKTLYAGHRGNGKTTKLLTWLFGGEQVKGYPGWNRILLVPGPGVENVEMLKPAFREMAMAKAESEDVETPEWGELDFSHRVYSVDEWQRTRNLTQHGVEIAIDGLDQMPYRIDQIRGEVVMIALWVEVDVRDPAEGMNMKELAEHAQAADDRYRTIREAGRDQRRPPPSATWRRDRPSWPDWRP